MTRKPSKQSELFHQLRLHNIMMTEAKDSPFVLAFHQRRWNEIRAELVEHQAKLAARKQPPAHVAEAARARWRYYGAIGQLHMARTCVQYIPNLPAANTEAKNLAVEIEQMLFKLISILSERKP